MCFTGNLDIVMNGYMHIDKENTEYPYNDINIHRRRGGMHTEQVYIEKSI